LAGWDRGAGDLSGFATGWRGGLRRRRRRRRAGRGRAGRRRGRRRGRPGRRRGRRGRLRRGWGRGWGYGRYRRRRRGRGRYGVGRCGVGRGGVGGCGLRRCRGRRGAAARTGRCRAAALRGGPGLLGGRRVPGGVPPLPPVVRVRGQDQLGTWLDVVGVVGVPLGQAGVERGDLGIAQLVPQVPPGDVPHPVALGDLVDQRTGGLVGVGRRLLVGDRGALRVRDHAVVRLRQGRRAPALAVRH